MLSRLLPVAVAAVFAVPATAGAATRTFKVVKATHTSSASESIDDYTGSSTVSWSLAKPSRTADNRVTVSRVGEMITGLGQVNISGAYSIDASTQYGHCAWTAATGDQEHPASAPADFQLTFGPNPHTGKGLLAGIGAARATLGNPYLGTECSGELDGEPSLDETNLIPVKPSALKRRKVTLRFRGATSRDGVDYRWSTVIVLKRR